MAFKDPFLQHISDGMAQFGLDLKDVDQVGDLYQLDLSERVSGGGYVALARKSDTLDPAKYWGGVLDNQLKDLLKSSIDGDTPLPAALIVPSDEAEYILSESVKRGAKPTIYQLFDGFVVVGYRKTDTEQLLNSAKPVPRSQNLPKASGKSKVDQPTSAPDGKGGNLRKLAAAALLGVAVSSIPFAINKFSDEPLSPELPKVELSNSVAVSIESAIDGSEGNPELHSALASNAPLPTQELERLIKEGYLKDVAKNPYITVAQMEALAEDPDPMVRAALGYNKGLPPHLAIKLAKDKMPIVRGAVSSNKALPLEYLDMLAADKEYAVRASVLDSPNITLDILDKVEPVPSSANCENREKIYATPCIAKAMLEYNYDNNDDCIRRGVAKSKNTSPEQLMKLTSDNDRGVRENALANERLGGGNVAQLNSKYFPKSDKDWQKKADGNNSWDIVNDRKALLSNPAQPLAQSQSVGQSQHPAQNIVGQVLQSPDKYGADLVKSGILSTAQAAAMYDYARPKKGVKGLFEELNKLPENKSVAKYLNHLNDTNPDPKYWERGLRSYINNRFKDSLYDPVSLAKQLSKPENGLILKDNKSAPTSSLNLLELPNVGDTGGFFDSEGDPDIRLADPEKDTFVGFFDDVDEGRAKKSNVPYEVLKASDGIVDDIVKQVTPAMAVVIKSPHGGVANTPNTSQGGDIPVNSIDGRSGEISINKSPSGNTLDLFADNDLYAKSCKKIDTLSQQVQRAYKI